MAHDTAKATAALRGLTAKFDNSVRSYPAFYPQVAMTANSTGQDERYAFLGRVPGVREWVGDRVFEELRATDWTLKNKSWEDSVRIEREDIEDDRLGLYGPILEQLGVRAAMHPDELLFDLVNNAETGDCFDGQDFFDTDHSWGDSGTQSNDLTYNANDHTAVTVAEFKAAYNAARQSLLGFKDDRGKLMNGVVYQGMSGLLCLIPPNLEQVAYEALTAMLGSSGGTNIIIDRPAIVTSASFTGTAKFDLYKTDMPIKPFIFQARKALERQMKGLTDLEFKDVKFMTYARYNLGYGAWWTAVRTTFN